MNTNALRNYWKSEEAVAHIHGWDFSYINDRYTEEDTLPWNYEAVIRQWLRGDHKLLDIDTGGGEFLLSLHHPYALTSAVEGFAPNVALCRETLLPLGIDFREAQDCKALPFHDSTFDMIINRHGDYDPKELRRILKPGGIFITQQVGGHNDRELVDLLLPGTPIPYPRQNLREQTQCFLREGFSVLQSDEAYGSIRFYDVGALVWFARIIEWEFPGFSVDACFSQLLKAQQILETTGSVDGTTHRFLLVVRK